MATRVAKRDVSWDVRGWKVQFKKQDEPGPTARVFRGPRGALLVEHGGHGQTRVRELTLEGAEPRRSEVLGGRLQAAEAVGASLAVLVEAGLRFFDAVSFSASAAIAVDRLATRLAVSPWGERCYVGSTRFTQVVDGQRGVTGTLQGFGPPALAIALEAARELWVHPGERLLRLVGFDDAGRPGVLDATELGLLAHLERFLRVDDGPLVALGKERSLDGMPFPGGAFDRALERVSFSPSGLERHLVRPQSRVLDLLGRDAAGFVVALEARGNTRVQLLDPATLEEAASCAFPRSGMYTLSALVSPTAVLGLRRHTKLDHAYLLSWGERAAAAELRVADAKVSAA